MIDHLCLLVPEGIVKEIEYITGSNDLFKNVIVIPISYNNPLEQRCDCLDCGSIQQTLDSSNCYHKALLLYGSECPQIIEPSSKETLHTHGVGNTSKLMLSDRELKEHKDEYLISSGWLDKIIRLAENDELEKERIRKYIDMSYSSILHIETGFYGDSSQNIEILSEISGKPVETKMVDIDLMKLRLENIVFEYDCTSKNKNIKEVTERIASYSMSIEIIEELVELKDEKEVANKITQMFYTLFAPEKVSYFSLKNGIVQPEYSTSFDPEKELNMDFLKMDQQYLISENRDGFLLKVKNYTGTMGIVEVKGFSLPENIKEYLNTAIVIAKASSLVVLNIRRYQEILESKKHQQNLTDTLKVMNKILRHDIANNLNVEINGIEIYLLKKDEKFLEMAQSSAYRSVETIKNMKDMESQFISDDPNLIPYHVHDIIESACKYFNINISIEGNALIMADSALPSVIENIIRNAQIHGNADSIRVTIEDDQTNCRISIMDDGIGIPDAIKIHIFDEGFKYGDTGNTGIGLYIVKNTIERYNGNISVKDNIPHGTVFVIELPSIHTISID